MSQIEYTEPATRGAAAVVLNVTVVDPSAPGFVTVFPCGAALPVASGTMARIASRRGMWAG